MLAVLVLVLFATLAGAVLLFLRRRYTYWSSRKVPGPEPAVPFGNFVSTVLGRQSMASRLDDIYAQHRDDPYVGIFFAHQPLLQVHDLHILKSVFVSDFQDFHGRGIHSDPEYDPMSGNLFNASGTQWRTLRVKLSPTFSTGKIKYMFSRIQECSENLKSTLADKVKTEGGSAVADIKEVFACFTTDLISSVAFGVESNSLRNRDSEFHRMGNKIFEPTFRVGIRLLCTFFAPSLMKLFRLKFLLPEVEEFFKCLVRDTMQYREQHGVEREDMMNLLLHLKNKGFVPPDNPSEEVDKKQSLKKLTTDEVAAQVMVFFIAGFETTSTLSSLAIYQICKHPEVQEKVVQELDEIMKKHGGVITYEAVMEAKYLEQVVSETLRFFPGVPFLTRQAMRRVKLPGTDLTLEKGTVLIIPTAAIQKDPEYWPDPLHFDPERFSEENRPAIPQMAYMPFGEGPRLCIGQRLGLVQVKVAIMTLMYSFTLSPCSETPTSLKTDPRLITFTPVEGIHLRLTPRTPIVAT